jgi:predicted metalloprotease with PDZ domain
MLTLRDLVPPACALAALMVPNALAAGAPQPPREPVASAAEPLPVPPDRVFVFAGPGPQRRAVIGLQVEPGPSGDGARVREVIPGGPADAAGIRAGDVIVAIDGTDLRGRDDPGRALIERMGAVATDQKLELRVLRDGRARAVEVTARGSPAPGEGPRAFTMPLPPHGSGVLVAPAAPLPLPSGGFPGMSFPLPDPLAEWLGGGVSGLELTTLSPRLGRYFGVEKGVLVVRCPADAGAWKLEDGDVLVAIDGRVPTSGAHASRILRSYQVGEKLELSIVRERRPLKFQVTVPESGRFIERGTASLIGQPGTGA